MYSQHEEDTELEKLVVKMLDSIPKTVVDVGAGDGRFLSNTRLFTEKYGFSGLMFEPTEEPFKLLEREYADNPSVVCLQDAVSDIEESYQMQEGNQNGIIHWTLSNVLYSPEGEKKTVRLSRVLPEHNLTEIGLLSVDTEGHDTKVLQDLILYSDIRPVVIITEVINNEMVDVNRRLLHEYDIANQIQFNYIFLRKDYAKELNRRTD